MTDVPEPSDPGSDEDPQAPCEPSDTDGDRDQAMDALIAQARINRGNVMDDEYQPLSNPDVGRIRTKIDRFLEGQERLPASQRITRSKLATAIGESKGTVSQVLTNQYPKGKQSGYRKRDEILRKLDRFLQIQEARREAPQRTGFVRTVVAEEIRAVGHSCVLLETMGAVWGPAGIGKTLTAYALLDVFPGSVLVTIDDGVHSPTTFLRELARKLHLPSASAQRQSLRRAICEKLAQSRRLVMVDEGHLATLETLNCARQVVHDACHCPVLFLGLPALARMLMKGRGDDSRGATLYSRIGISRDLTERCRNNGHRGEPLYSVADIKRVFAGSQLRIANDAMDWLEGLANDPDAGGLRAANNALRLAMHVAKTSDEPCREITLKALLDASRLLKGVEGARAIANRIKQRHADQRRERVG